MSRRDACYVKQFQTPETESDEADGRLAARVTGNRIPIYAFLLMLNSMLPMRMYACLNWYMNIGQSGHRNFVNVSRRRK